MPGARGRTPCRSSGSASGHSQAGGPAWGQGCRPILGAARLLAQPLGPRVPRHHCRSAWLRLDEL